MRALAIALCAMAFPAMAQTGADIDCGRDDLSGVEYRFCAGQAYAMADDELNEVYRLVITRAKAFDVDAAADGLTGPITLEAAVRQAQRDWIAFRDSDCDALAVTYQGGTGGPLAGTLCRTEKTIDRVRDLRAMMADY